MSIDFHQLYSEVVESIDGLLHGVTEWSAQHTSHVALSLSWDWTLLSDGDIQLRSPVQVRTNIMLISAQGYDQGTIRTDTACVQRIGQLPWKNQITSFLDTVG